MNFTLYTTVLKKLWVYLLACSFFLFNMSMSAQSGCTDPLANNFDASAVTNDGSCAYDPASASASSTTNLSSPTLNENSGLIVWDNAIWTHLDSGGPNELYKLSLSDFSILATISLTGTTNNDWEDIAQDNDYIYVGDFGNNSNGNRTDLKIYRILKSSISGSPPFSPVIDEINFSYADQTDFSPQGGNNTDFDCEAMIVTQNNIYLFTKEWISEETTLYSLPKIPATEANEHMTVNEGSYDVNGLITGATYVEDKNLVVLSGYPNPDTGFGPFLVLLYDFNGHDFFSGNKRKISTNLFRPQIEGIASSDGINIFVSNEQSGGFISPGVQRINLLNFLGYETSGSATQFSNPAAWEAGIVPPSGRYAIISHDLNIDQNTTIENLKINENISLTTQPNITLTVQNQLAIVPDATLRLKENSVLDVNGDISNNGLIYFESNSNGTAQLDVFNGTSSGSGQVTVERHIPASKRAFRFLSTPVSSTGTIRENWQQDGLDPGDANYEANVGTHITGQGGAANGFDNSSTNNPSLFTFNNTGNATSTQDDDWEEVTNTNSNTLQANTPYILFVRGDRTAANLAPNPPAAQATTLRTTGDNSSFFNTGPVSSVLNQTNDDFSLVANPYQATVNFDLASTNNLRSDVIVWNPDFGTNGQYETLLNNRFIQPGQSFFVQNDDDISDPAGGASIAFEEADKNLTGSSGVTVFNEAEMSLNLELFNDNDIKMDVMKFRFQAGGNNGYGNEDMGKLFSATENLCSVNSSAFLSVERRDIPQDDEVIALHVEHYQTTNYAFKINSDNWDSGIDTYIYDGHLNIYTVIEPNVPFNFTVDPGIPESLASDRFSLVFNPQNLGLDEESFQNAIIASPNPVAGAQLELNIPEHLSGNSAVIEIYNSTGQLLMHKTYAQITNSETLDLSGFEGGMYILSIKTDKYKQQLKLIKP